MQAAEASLRELNIYEPDPAIYTAVLSKVRRASLDCYVHEVSFYVIVITKSVPGTLLSAWLTVWSLKLVDHVCGHGI